MARKHARPDGTETLVREIPSRPLDAVIRVLDAPAKPKAYRLTQGRCTIGAAPDCDVVIEATTVSRKHVELELVPDGVRVTDLGSRNGTFYLGQRVETITLSLGARLTLGTASVVLDADTSAIEAAPLHEGDAYRGMIGTSLPMRRLFGTLLRLEGSRVPVLVTGESGVGKELVARALHLGSSVADGPFISLNCGAIPRELITSELFGHRRGAFTGAIETRLGAFKAADGGTLFLDEIGELPLDVQPVLLRALETGEIQPVGGESSEVRVRLVAATNRDLTTACREGRFREDLFYRLAVVKLQVPSLRERVDDVEPLARMFAAAAGGGNLPASIMQQIKARSYPGNVRELRNVVQAWLAVGALPDAAGPRTGELEALLADRIDVLRPYGEQKEAVSDIFTKVYLQAVLSHTNYNQSQAAKLAGLDRSYLGKLVVKHGLSK
jgi:DNA-binding NtrC family response regulator